MMIQVYKIKGLMFFFIIVRIFKIYLFFLMHPVEINVVALYS
jgi:hypothetical protein